jgi:hypothetical protein
LQQVFDKVATASLKKRFQALAREKADAPLDGGRFAPGKSAIRQ